MKTKTDFQNRSLWKESYLAETTKDVLEKNISIRSPFTIEVRFLGGLSETQKQAFKLAADRWCNIIIGALPSVIVDGEVINNLLILAQGENIDGPGSILGQAGPTFLRPSVAGNASFLPAKGIMSFDSADLMNMEAEGTLNDVIAHEMGHVLGIGTIWMQKRLLRNAGTNNPNFIGESGMREYAILRGTPNLPTPIPVENTGGGGTRDSHWRETIFKNELMSGFIAIAGNPISSITVGSLSDMGYEVNLAAAEPYQLSDLFSLAESGLLLKSDEHKRGVMLSNIPIVLPEGSLI